MEPSGQQKDLYVNISPFLSFYVKNYADLKK